MSDWILAGLITPDELRLACYRLQDGPFVPLKEKSYAVKNVESFETILEDFHHSFTLDFLSPLCLGLQNGKNLVLLAQPRDIVELE